MRSLSICKCLATAGLAHFAGASNGVIPTSTEDSNAPSVDLSRRRRVPSSVTAEQRLAVVVHSYRGDLDRAVVSLERWPTNCSPTILRNVDLVLYYAEGEEDSFAVKEAARAIAGTAGRCFANLRFVYAHLEKEVRSDLVHARVALRIMRDERFARPLCHPPVPTLDL